MATRVEIEESVYLAGTDGPRRTVQIVIYGHARETAAVRGACAIRRSTAQAPAAPAGRAGIAAVTPVDAQRAAITFAA